MIQKDKEEAFKKDLSNLINRHSLENGSDTPDYLLAEYLCDCLSNYNKTVTLRDIRTRGE